MDRAQFIVGSAAWLAGLTFPGSLILGHSGAAAAPQPSPPVIHKQPGRFGISFDSWSLDDATRETCLDILDELGATWFRASASWYVMDEDVSEAEGLVGDFSKRDWSWFDRRVDSALARNKSVIVAVIQWAAWANGGHDGWWVPETGGFAAWGDYCTALAEHCETRWPGRIRHFEIWNEPDCPRFWTNPATWLPNGCYASEYVKLLREAYLGIKGVIPGARIIGPVVGRADVGFLRRCYSQAALLFPDEHEAMNDYFDVLGCHPYCDSRAPDDNDPHFIWNDGTLNRNFIGLNDLYNELMAHGDGHKSVICTEFGWRVSPTFAGDPHVVSEAVQADYMSRAFDMVRDWPWLEVLMSYGLRSVPFAHEEPFTPVRADWSHRPSYDAWIYATRSGT